MTALLASLMPRDVSVGGGRVDELLAAGLAWIAVLFTALAGAMVWAAVWHTRAHAASGARGDDRRATLRTAGVALAIFGAVDGTLLVRGVEDVQRVFWDFAAVDARPDVVRIELDAHQWSWDARYAGPDGAFNTADDALALNDLVVPAGAPVIIQLASIDVIHSFFVPSLRVKNDAVPGRINTLTFTAAEPGDYEIACAQLCGVNHYKMRGVLHVVPPEAFHTWLARTSDAGTRAYDPDDAAAHWGWPWSARR